MSDLPIGPLIPAIISALGQHNQLIVQAAPGAGKSTVLPLVLLQQGGFGGRILMLEPRRLAARNIARYLAGLLGEPVGGRVGYRVRGEQQVGPATRLEIVTEGILTRLLQADPELGGIDLLIFDEFHERSLHADTALAFALEAQAALRPDLRLLIMSATLDGLDLPRLLPDAPVLQCEGRAFPIAYHYRPVNRQQPLIPQWGQVVLEASEAQAGSLLVFLPGVAEIERLAEWLAPRLGDELQLAPLHGRLEVAAQQAAILPAPGGQRKLVLATNVAETSLTIEGIQVVVDCGLERRARFDLASGIQRLETRQIARASATQRAGRAGRLGPGVCYRLWSREQQERLEEQSPPEICQLELSQLVLEAGLWGTEPEALPLLDPPPAPALAAARRLLRWLEALDEQGRLTARGRAMAGWPCHPRLGHLLLRARELAADGLPGLLQEACYLVALLEEDKRGSDSLHGLLSRHAGALRAPARRWLTRLQAADGKPGLAWLGLLAALAWPDRIARRRSGQRYQLAGGQSADLVEGHSLGGSDWLVAVELGLGEQGIRIFVAEPLDLQQLERQLPELFSQQEWLGWDAREGRVRAERQRCLGQIVLERTPLSELSDEQKGRCLLDGIRQAGLACLPWDEESSQWLARARCGRDWLPELDLPPLDEASLLATLEQWLLPHLSGLGGRLEALKRLDLMAIVRSSLSWEQSRALDEALPTHFTAPTGSRIRIRYQPGQPPALPVRIQEMFGQRETPSVARGRVPLLVELLSPARRPLQLTQDLVAFWQGAYGEVKKEMKGRYPKHYWPDDPLQAQPTRVTKQRMKDFHGTT